MLILLINKNDFYSSSHYNILKYYFNIIILLKIKIKKKKKKIKSTK